MNIKQDLYQDIRVRLQTGSSPKEIMATLPLATERKIKKVCKRLHTYHKKNAQHPRNRNKDNTRYLARYDWVVRSKAE